MSTQYNSIQAPYDEIRKTSIALIEKQNVHDAVAPFIEGSRVLDLACGSGFYTKEFSKWGAGSVLGVDISAAMLTEAQRAVSNEASNSQVVFLEADCSKPVAYTGGPFQVVFGAWLLNYAPSAKELTELFRNISLNLEPGGHFVGVTPPPTQDPAAFYEAENHARPHGSGFLMGHPTRLLEDGCAVHTQGETALGTVEFDNYHLRRDVYERAARDGGLQGTMEWNLTTVPNGFEEPIIEGESREEIESYKLVPNYGILVIAK
ncbi:putative Methyltransferase domain-containing protein [Seiridium cardinale]|uniref:Methyltransferase domain-containing protein n=1 Tax=Seiridium cardinale TaxID=138064 RepID=A0ABR2XWQ2_9PEZI